MLKSLKNCLEVQENREDSDGVVVAQGESLGNRCQASDNGVNNCVIANDILRGRRVPLRLEVSVLRKSCSPKQTKPRVLARFKEAKLNVKAKFIYIFINCKMFNSEKRKSYPYCGC